MAHQCDLVLLPLVQKSWGSHVSPVEVFVIGIKIESSDPHSFWELIKGSG